MRSDGGDADPSGHGLVIACGPEITGGRSMARFHEFEMESITGEPVHFSEYEGRLSLVVNVASR